jgi:SpoVK/Ycf46/Vps4 family AAA+-type ATPase
MPLKHGRIFEEIGVQPPRGVLITGPTGSGKSALGQALCRDLNERFGLQVFVKHATELVGSLSGESERNIRSLF